MSLLDKFKEQFAPRDDEYDDEGYEEEEEVNTSAPVPPKPYAAAGQTGKAVYHGGCQSERLWRCGKNCRSLEIFPPCCDEYGENGYGRSTAHCRFRTGRHVCTGRTD